MKAKLILLIFVLFSFSILCFSDSESATDWLMFGKNLNNNAWDGVSYSDLKINATLSIGQDIRSSPAIWNGYVYISAWDGNLYQLNASNVSKIINSKNIYTGAYITQSSPSIQGEYIYVGSSDGNLYQLNASNISKTIGIYATTTNSNSRPIISNGYAYIGGINGLIYQLNASNISKLINSYNTTSTTGFLNSQMSAPAISNDNLYIGISYSSYYVFQLNASNVSKLIEKYSTSGMGRISSPAISNGYVYIAELQLNASNISQIIATSATGGGVSSSPAISNGYVFIGSEGGGLFVLNSTNISKQIKTFPTGSVYLSSPAVSNNYVYIGSFDNSVYQYYIGDILIDITKPLIYFNSNTQTSGVVTSKTYIYINTTMSDLNPKNITVFIYNSAGTLINRTDFTTTNGIVNYTTSTQDIFFFNATAYDLAGNSNSTETRNMTVDSGAPFILFSAGTEESGTTKLETSGYVSVLAGDENPLTIILNIFKSNGNLLNGLATSGDDLIINFSNLDAGLYYFNATATDSIGNSNSTETRNFTISAGLTINSFNFTTSTLTYSSSYSIAYSISNYTGITLKWYVNDIEKTSMENQTTISGQLPPTNITVTLTAYDSVSSQSRSINMTVPYLDSIYLPTSITKTGTLNENITATAQIYHTIYQNATYNYSVNMNHENITFVFGTNPLSVIQTQLNTTNVTIVAGEVSQGTYYGNITLTRLEDGTSFKIPVTLYIDYTIGRIEFINETDDWISVFSGLSLQKTWYLNNSGNRDLTSCIATVIDDNSNGISSLVSFDKTNFIIPFNSTLTSITGTFSSGIDGVTYKGHPKITCISTNNSEYDIYESGLPQIIIISQIVSTTGGTGGSSGGTTLPETTTTTTTQTTYSSPSFLTTFLGFGGNKSFKLKTVFSGENWVCTGQVNQTFAQACGQKKMKFQLTNELDKEINVGLLCDKKANSDSICNWLKIEPNMIKLAPKETKYFEVVGTIPEYALSLSDNSKDYYFVIKAYSPDAGAEKYSSNKITVNRGDVFSEFFASFSQDLAGIMKIIWLAGIWALLTALIYATRDYARNLIHNDNAKWFLWIGLYVASMIIIVIL